MVAHANPLLLIENCLQAISLIKSQVDGAQVLKVKIQENLMQAQIELQECAGAIDKERLSSARDILEEVKTIVLHINPRKLKMTFMPYKYSMWDSLESIYIAAQECNNISVDLIPVPYWSKDSENNLDKFFNESEYFEEKYPILNYDVLAGDYCGDVLFVHNPFDGLNNLTTIDDRFYLKNLRGRFSKIIYVPYYVATSFPSFESFIGENIYPNMVYLDKIITLNSKHAALFEACGIPSASLEIQGSPKIDALLDQTQMKPPKLERWSASIAGKKVFLLNTTLGTLLNKEGYFDRLKSVISQLLDDNEIALIWRPHPLFDDLIDKSFPEYRATYDSFKDLVASAPNAYLDTYHNAIPALQLADAMISETSALLRQYAALHRPILMMDDVEMAEDEQLHIFDYRHLDSMSSSGDLKNFIRNVKTGDPALKERAASSSVSLYNTEGTVGQKIVQSCLQEFEML